MLHTAGPDTVSGWRTLTGGLTKTAPPTTLKPRPEEQETIRRLLSALSREIGIRCLASYAMVDQSPQSNSPPPSSPFVSNRGPRTGPILGNDTPGAIGVLAEGEPMPIGIAYPVGLVEHRRGPAQTFRLVVSKAELPGHWLCVGREFVQLGEAVEEL
jgi:hypothetical protein